MLAWLKDRFRRGPVVPVVRLSGVIASSGLLGNRSLSIETVAPLLKRAFDMRGAKAVALAINSPGGSPVQSALIGQRIRLLADEIIVDPHSIVGSIGVISAGFGFQDLIGRIGVERRVYTSGERKSMLDPFRPQKPEDVERLMRLQAEIHDGFKDWVRQRRAGKLKGEEQFLFSGEFWTGRRGAELGLIDGLGELRATLQARYGAKVHLPVIGPRRRLLSRFGLGSSVDGIGPSTLAALEERLHWQRFGL